MAITQPIFVKLNRIRASEILVVAMFGQFGNYWVKMGVAYMCKPGGTGDPKPLRNFDQV